MIEINNLTTILIDENFLKKIAKIVLEGELSLKNKKNKTPEVSLALVGPEKIKKLNKKYLGRSRETDVLAFGQNQKFTEPFLGEIVICPKEVSKNAKRFGASFENELARILIHGILHLLGYDHEKKEKKEREMREKEEYYLSQIVKIKN